jgi:hypothetical protein
VGIYYLYRSARTKDEAQGLYGSFEMDKSQVEGFLNRSILLSCKEELRFFYNMVVSVKVGADERERHE